MNFRYWPIGCASPQRDGESNEVDPLISPACFPEIFQAALQEGNSQEFSARGDLSWRAGARRRSHNSGYNLPPKVLQSWELRVPETSKGLMKLHTSFDQNICIRNQQKPGKGAEGRYNLGFRDQLEFLLARVEHLIIFWASSKWSERNLTLI